MKSKLSDICLIEKGKQIDTNLLDDLNPYKYINGGIKESGFYTDFNTDEPVVTVSEGGASCGYVGYVEEKFWCGCHCYKLSKCKVEPKYLYYALKSNQQKIMNLRTGATMPNIKKELFKQLEINVDLDRDNQLRVINELDNIQNLLNVNVKKLESFDELIKSRFNEMFGDVKSNSKALLTVKGDKLFKFSSGKFLEVNKRLNEGVPVYGGNGIAWYTNESLIEYPTIVIGRVGAYCGNVRLVKEKCWITDNALYIKEFKNSNLNLTYLLFLFDQIEFNRFNDIVAQPKITQKPLENYLYPIPSINEQNQFETFVNQIGKLKFVVQQQIKDLEELLDKKMDEYFGG